MVDNFDITKKGPSSSLNQFPIRSKGKQSTTGRDSNYRVKKELSAKKSYPKRNFNRYKYQFKVASKKTINLYDPPSNASNDDPNDQSSSIEEFIIKFVLITSNSILLKFLFFGFDLISLCLFLALLHSWLLSFYLLLFAFPFYLLRLLSSRGHFSLLHLLFNLLISLLF